MKNTFVTTLLGFWFISASTVVLAEDPEVAKAIEQQVISASDCQELAYGVKLKHLDADRQFSDCVERRAIRIAIVKKYGPEKLGKIDIIDKLEAYTHLAESKNSMVQEEANRHMTAAGK